MPRSSASILTTWRVRTSSANSSISLCPYLFPWSCRRCRTFCMLLTQPLQDDDVNPVERTLRNELFQLSERLKIMKLESKHV
jgi:hypothetical protein